MDAFTSWHRFDISVVFLNSLIGLIVGITDIVLTSCFMLFIQGIIVTLLYYNYGILVKKKTSTRQI